ncbi:hypothetical protein PG996_009012 [Apiospora saccharicola]|uniref:Clr5 domain-containing protein n=1 Tax=Apiospora saccharicola TaxID=335842 RepID=A0ABR1UJK1_9PEZI
MAAPTCNIPREDWEKHRATILDLYCEKRLPLTRRGDAREKKQCVDWIMRHQHDFAASQSQYEAQLKRWGFVKNLKQDEWVSLLTDHDRLESLGREVRVVISGKVQSKERIRKARHRYGKSSVMRAHGTSQGTALTPGRQAFVEIMESGVWKRWSSDDLPATSNALVPSPGPHQSSASRPPESLPSGTPSIPLPQLGETLPDSPDVPQAIVPARSPERYPFGTSLFSPPFSSPDFDVNGFDSGLGIVEIDTSYHSVFGARFDLFGSGISPRVLQNDFIWSEDIWPNLTMQNGRSSHEGSVAAHEPTQRDSAESGQSLVPLLRGETVTATAHGSVPGIIERLHSLISPDSLFWQSYRSSTTVGTAFGVENAHFATLLYSMMNGFASLDDGSQTPILQMLSGHEGYLKHLKHVLLNGPDSMAKQLADSLFRGAVASNDSRTVSLLLEVTRNRSSIAIDLNEFHCTHHHYGPVNPIMLALCSGDEEVTRILLEAGADLKKLRPNGCQSRRTRPALEIFLGRKDLTQTKKVQLSRLLISHGAEITGGAVDIAIARATKDLPVLKALIELLPADRHMMMFQDQYGGPGATAVEGIVRFLENSVATSLVKKLVDDCNSTNCGNCLSKNSRSMNNLLEHAARRGNIDLVELFAQYATSLSDALAGAVRSGKMELVRFLVERGARADGPACRVDDDDDATTPLAEAISQEDTDMVDILQEYGAWTCINQQIHFVAATTAAATVGNIHYLETIITRARLSMRECLGSALLQAVKSNKSDAVLALLRYGANANSDSCDQNNLCLRIALWHRNKKVVDALLESIWGSDLLENYIDKRYSHGVDGLGFAMELACVWGEMDIISHFASLGLPLDTGYHQTPLTAAVRVRNYTLVEYLLKLGADPGAKAQSGCTPLGAAVDNGDQEMMSYLLSAGASPVDVYAFTKAFKHDTTVISKLSSAFLAMYPPGRRGFGGDLLIEAIYMNHELQIEVLISMKVDLDSLVDNIAKANEHVWPDRGYKEHTMRREGLLRFLQTPLLLAVETGSKDLIVMLLEHGADINRPARRGIVHTPLQKACELGSYSMVEFLLQKGALPSSPPSKQNGGTALQLAAKSGSLRITELLLQVGADAHAPAPEFGGGNTAFGWAAEKGRYHILLLLWNMAPRDGFTVDVLQKACELAKENAHRGCVDIITSMMHDSSFGRSISLGAEGGGG